MTTFLVLGGIALLVAGYLVVNWWAEGRKARRSLLQPWDGHADKAGDYDVIKRQDHEGLRNSGNGV
jgi:hypothetical protein